MAAACVCAEASDALATAESADGGRDEWVSPDTYSSSNRNASSPSKSPEIVKTAFRGVHHTSLSNVTPSASSAGGGHAKRPSSNSPRRPGCSSEELRPAAPTEA